MWKRDVFTCRSQAEFLLQADSVVYTVLSLSALPGKGASSPSCPVQLNMAGDPASNTGAARAGWELVSIRSVQDQ